MPAVRNWHVPAASALLASSVIAITPVASPPDLRIANLDVRLASTDFLDTIATDLGSAGTNFSNFVDGALANLSSGLDLDEHASQLGSLLTTTLGSLLFANAPDGSIQNFLYNVVADTLNIGYQESLASQEEAYALGPAGSIGGVAGRIPPGTPDSAIYTDPDTGEQYYALGGTGSYWYESVGNTWGWDDGNWPQLDGIGSALLPFNWAQPIANLVQGILQAEAVDGAQVNCEFECASFVDYFGQWFKTPLNEVLSPGYTYPAVPANTLGENSSTGVINTSPAGSDVIWSGQHPDLSLSATLQDIYNDWTAPAASNPIEIPNPATELTNLANITGDFINDFDGFVTGSFVYWGAPALYSVPSLIGGAIHDLTGGLIPNPFGDTAPWQEHGAEPLSGYTDGPSSLLPGLQHGFQYLMNGLEKYLEPSTYEVGTASADTSTLSSDLSTLLDPGGSSDLSGLLGLF